MIFISSNSTIDATSVAFNILKIRKKYITMKKNEAIDLIDEIYKLQDVIIKKANIELASSDVDFSIKIALKDIIYICGITQDKAINAMHKLTIDDETL